MLAIWGLTMKGLLIGLLLGFGGTLSAQPSDKSTSQPVAAPTVATFKDFPPYITETEPDDGILSVIVKESFARAGINPSYTLVPWRRSQRAVMIGEMQASFSWAYSTDRDRDFHLSAPIFSISNQLLTTYENVETWQQLGDPKIVGSKPILCVPVGWKIATEIKDMIDRGQLQRMSPGHPRYCMELFRAQRTNVVYMPRMTAVHYLNEMQEATETTASRPWPDLYGIEVPSGIANTQHVLFTRDEAGLALKDSFNQGFEDLVSSGRYREILQSYLNGYPETERLAIYQEQIKAGILPAE